MRKQPADDWGVAIGADPDGPAPVAKRKPARQDNLTSLIYYFNDMLPRDVWGKLNSPVNPRAMMVGLKKLKEAGHSVPDIRAMMDSFLLEISRKPLPNGVAPWRGFLANLDRLSNQVPSTETSTYDDIEVDRRL